MLIGTNELDTSIVHPLRERQPALLKGVPGRHPLPEKRERFIHQDSWPDQGLQDAYDARTERIGDLDEVRERPDEPYAVHRICSSVPHGNVVHVDTSAAYHFIDGIGSGRERYPRRACGC